MMFLFNKFIEEVLEFSVYVNQLPIHHSAHFLQNNKTLGSEFPVLCLRYDHTQISVFLI